MLPLEHSVERSTQGQGNAPVHAQLVLPLQEDNSRYLLLHILLYLNALRTTCNNTESYLRT